jgi:membrane protein DedA with SNARE-associated domain
MKLASELHPVLSHLLAEGRPLLEHYGYPGLFVTNFAEAMGIPLPGQTLLAAAAMLATQGELSVHAVVALAFAGTLAGSCVGYLIGRTGGRALLLRCKLPPERIERLEALFARRGALVVVAARFVDGLRQTAPLVAGSLKMPWWRFFLASVAGSAAWVGAWGIGIYSLAEHSQQILAALHHVSNAGWWVTGLIAVALLAWLYSRRGAT